MVSPTARTSTSSEPSREGRRGCVVDLGSARRVAFKSPATISKPQETATYGGESGVLEAKGRHDPCVVPRCVH